MFNKILVFAPHPDDETIGCGGTLLKFKHDNSLIKVVLVTKGELFKPANEADDFRLKEFREALKSLQIDDFICLNYQDGNIPISGKILDEYLKIYNDFLPTAIFLPSLSDQHIDHVNVTRGVLKALENNLQFHTVLNFYEVVNPININIVYDISEYFEKKLEAFQCYKSQHNKYNYLQSLKSIAALRGAAIGKDFGEGFLQFVWDGGKENFFTESPFISVIIRAHKKHFLINSLESLLNQTYPLFEVIIVWFGNEQLEIPEKFNKLDYKILFGKKSRSFNLNLGIENSSGDFISFLDEDDIFYPEHIAELSEILVANKDIDIVYSGANLTKCKLEKKIIKKIAKISVFNFPYEKGKLLVENYIPLNTLMIKRHIFNQIKFSEEFEAYEDWVFLLEAENKCFNFYHHNKITCEYRIFTEDYVVSHYKKGYTEIEKKVREYIFKNFKFENYENLVSIITGLKAEKDYIEKKLAQFAEKLNFYKESLKKRERIFDTFKSIFRKISTSVSDDYLPYYFLNFLGENRNLPSFSIIVVVADPEKNVFIETLYSIFNQIYNFWELIVFNNNSKSEEILNILKDLKEKFDNSQKGIIVNSDKTLSIPEAYNEAAKLAQNDYLLFVDHDDYILPETLSEIAINVSHKDYKFCYTDSYTIDISGKAFIYHQKPDWSPETLLSFNYINHLTVFKKDFWNKLNGYSNKYHGAQDWEILLRMRNLVDDNEVLHIKKPLYGWRAHIGSTAYKISEKEWLKPVIKKVWLEKIGKIFQDYTDKISAESNMGPGFLFPYTSEYLPEINIIIPSKDNMLYLKNCVESLLKCRYPKFNITVIDNGSFEDKTLNYLKQIEKKENINIIFEKVDFNWSALNNIAINSINIKNSIILFLNDDIQILDKYFLLKMVQPFVIEKIGAVGAVLKFPDGQIQHNGIRTDVEWIASEIRTLGNNNILNVLRNVSAVTGACFMVRGEILDLIKFDENLPVNYNDVDFCLQIRKKGWRIVNNPNAVAIHYHMRTRSFKKPDDWEIDYMKKKWGNFLEERYYYNWETVAEKTMFLKI